MIQPRLKAGREIVKVKEALRKKHGYRDEKSSGFYKERELMRKRGLLENINPVFAQARFGVIRLHISEAEGGILGYSEEYYR